MTKDQKQAIKEIYEAMEQLLQLADMMEDILNTAVDVWGGAGPDCSIVLEGVQL